MPNSINAWALTSRSTGANPYGLSSLPGFGNERADGNHQAGIRFTTVITPRVTNEFRVGYTRSKSYSNWVSGNPEIDSLVSALSGVSGGNGAGLPRITITGLEAAGHPSAQPVDITVNAFQFCDSVSIAKGRHFMRIGADIIWTQFFQLFNNNARGSINFRGSWTPRFGFAWRPFNGSRLAIRGGYGIFYSNSTQNAARQLLANNFPFSVSENFTRVVTIRWC